MKENKKIYIVTCGEYSDYRIDRVFSQKKLADEYLDGKSDDYRLEVYDLDEPMPERKTLLWRISLDLSTKKVRFCDHAYKYDIRDTVRISTCLGSDTKFLEFYIEADSKKRAIKVASERFGQVMAEESVRFPYLRSKIIEGHYSRGEFPLYDFKTAEIVLRDGEEFEDTFLVYDPETYDESKLSEYVPKGVRFRKEKQEG